MEKPALQSANYKQSLPRDRVQKLFKLDSDWEPGSKFSVLDPDSKFPIQNPWVKVPFSHKL